VRSLMICTRHQLFSCYQIRKNETDGTCSTYVGRGNAYRVLPLEAKTIYAELIS